MYLASIMPFRYEELGRAVEGYARTGVALIADGPRGLAPAGVSDDIGIYFFIPKVVHSLQVPLDRGIELFFTGSIVLSLLVGVIGGLLAFKTWPGRCAALLGALLIGLLCYKTGDVYLVPGVLALAVVPWLLYALNGRLKAGPTVIIGVLTGVAVGTGHYLRAHAGTAVVLFLVTLVLLYRRSPGRTRLALAAAFVVGLLLPVAGFARLVSQRDAYLIAHGVVPNADSHHAFWHSVYIGFGFLTNNHGIRYDDWVAIDLAKRRSPQVIIWSRGYEKIIKDEVFKLVREDPRLIGQTVFAKLGVLGFYLALFGGVGIALAVRRVNPFPSDLAFAVAIAFSALPGILVMPMASYLTGFIALCLLYGVVGVEHAATRRKEARVSASS